ncbi:MAG: AAA family ATPase [Deltaproteobacteria bacterium]|nr:AAA family ATPase [Deltaproteobacteria bacterium]
MKTIALFNHKGGVGKTTITVNVAHALGQLGIATLVVDCDPQCNATAFYLREDQVDALLNESIDPEEGGTIWSGIAKHVRARGEVRAVETWPVGSPVKASVQLLPGDVLLSSFEDRLSTAWKDSFSRDPTALDLMSALHRCIARTAQKVGAGLVLLDVGPSVGSLNRAMLLGCDYYITPVACDLFSLRALRAVGETLRSWVEDWQTIRGLAAKVTDVTLLPGVPAFMGYVTQHFNIYRGRSASAFEEWENKIAPRVNRDLVGPLRAIDESLVPDLGPKKMGAIPAFGSLAPLSHEHGLAIGALRGRVNSGFYPKIDEAEDIFRALAAQIKRRAAL